ncbi:hypothetical protein ACFO0N_05970 [Halobium salinum]|uniref:Uncharacterized protein n=1 Tax=Halobium salinum TaxID=1364940 RepID=A0ABD5P9P4_9EURY|nr:hypothetical protein [Halobium salinum]
MTITGVQLASNRYSHRIDTSILRSTPVISHFFPHVLAISIGVILLSSPRIQLYIYFVFVLLSILAILIIFPYMYWLVQALRPEKVLSAIIGEIDPEFLNGIDKVVEDQKSTIYESNDAEKIKNIFQEVRYLKVADENPVDSFLDVQRARIRDGDTRSAKQLLDKYREHVDEVVENQYRTFRTSHDTSQLACWYLYSPYEQIFRISLKQDNQAIMMQVVYLLRESVLSWQEKRVRGIPNVFIRLFGRITVDYASHFSRSQSQSVVTSYSKIARAIASDINSPGREFTDPLTNFVNYSLSFALQSIEEGDYRSARSINSALRSLVDATLEIPSGDPDRILLSMGLIGEAFAESDAVSKQIIEIANEPSSMNEAEWTITLLVTFKDKLEEYGNDYTSNEEIRERVLEEIDRINGALEERDRRIASKIDKDEEHVLAVIRASRHMRRPFSPNDILDEIDTTISADVVQNICESLKTINAITQDDDGNYSKSFESVSG